jgi:DSBA-like thioredoxin domain-containing protein
VTQTPAFSITWDYRCPFARNAAEHVIAGLQAGAPWDVRHVAFSLNQVHVGEGDPAVWDDPSTASALLAMQVGIAVRDKWPEAFPNAHLAVFAARHDEAQDIREEDVLRSILERHDLDADAVFDEIESGRPLEMFRREHEEAVSRHHVFGVPTFIVGDRAVFVRLMHRPGEDRDGGRHTIERVLELLTGWPELNEFKHTSIPR